MRHPEITPRNGHTLIVGIIARISGCANQKEVSLDDQVDHAKELINELYTGEVEYKIISTKGKGERLDRPELKEVETMLRSRTLDILIAEDLGRLVRGVEASWLCGIAVDHQTRVIVPNDCIDTSEQSWEEDVISACRDHVGHNAHTSKRIKYKSMNRFKKYGGATPLEIYGYVKEPNAKTYDDWRKVPEAEIIFREWFRRLELNPNCSALADWLNEQKVPTGKYCRQNFWDRHMVRRITANPLLKGMPARGITQTVKHHETGRRVSVRSDEEPNYRDCPHLCFIDPDLWERVNSLIVAANQRYRRKTVNGIDPRKNIPRKRTKFPGQHATWFYCGRQFLWGGNGTTGNLMCCGSRLYQCWNSVSINGAMVCRKVVAVIMEELTKLDRFEDQFRELVEQARAQGDLDQSRERAELQKSDSQTARQRENLIAAVAECGSIPMLKDKIKSLDEIERATSRRRHELDRERGQPLELPSSPAELRQLIEEKFLSLAIDSPECGDVLRLLVPEFSVYLVRLCDGGHPLPRARMTLKLGALFPDVTSSSPLTDVLTSERTIDLFEPTQREKFREAAVRMEAEGLPAADQASESAAFEA